MLGGIRSMSTVMHDRAFGGFSESALMFSIAALPVGAVLLYSPDAEGLGSMTMAAMAAGIVAGILLLVAATLSYVQWRTTTDPRQGWIVTAVVVVSGQAFLNAGVVIDPRHEVALDGGWALLHEGIAMVVILALSVTALRTQAHRMPNPMLLGALLVLALCGLRIGGLAVGAAWPHARVDVLATVVVVGHLVISGAVMMNGRLPYWARWRLALTMAMVGVGHVVGLGGVGNSTAELVSAAVLTTAGVLWASATFLLLRETDEAQRRRATALEGSLFEIETASRGAKERLHEARSIVAGLSSATRLLNDAAVAPDVRERLELTIHAELSRLERVISMTPTEPSTVDVDELLDTLLALHRARGRTIEWEPSGARVEGRLDAVAEAVNILLENSASHGGGVGSRVAVQSDPSEDVVRIRVSDEGPGIPADLRDRVFDWGVGRSDTPGQGIGLNLARRLVTEQGGTITLDEPSIGSSFVIRLPAARRSEEYDRDAARS